LAWSSKKFGIKAFIVMPKHAPLVKIQNTQALDAEVILEGDTLDDALEIAKRISKKTGKLFVHGFEDECIIAGNGTIGLEILKQLPEVDTIVCSIGGGGLMSGIAIALKELKPKTQLIGCQATGAASMIESFKSEHAISLGRVETFADGIAIKKTSEAIRKILQPRLSQLLHSDDEAIAGAVLTLAEKAKIVTEGAGALPLAVLEQIQRKIKNKNVVLIVSGGNLDVNVLSRIIDRGLTRAGRRLRLNVLISDRPGALANLTAFIAKMGVNILQTIHDRNEPYTHIDQTEVALTLETRGPEHTKKVISCLHEHVYRLEVVGSD
ncbi:MAG: pyridoxal-phosphate dependent enzyme, partial [Deltaproteobacteria bacterium]|nr:pyridoxal-phosphate dependent enzyme [Deltaproteobacteria bacterium]